MECYVADVDASSTTAAIELCGERAHRINIRNFSAPATGLAKFGPK